MCWWAKMTNGLVGCIQHLTIGHHSYLAAPHRHLAQGLLALKEATQNFPIFSHPSALKI